MQGHTRGIEPKCQKDWNSPFPSNVQSRYREMDLVTSSDLVFGDINLAFVCQRVVAFFSRADTDYILDGADEDGPITLVASGSCPLDGFHHLFNIVFTTTKFT